MTNYQNTPEFTALWNEWLKTDGGKDYQAGWGYYESRRYEELGRVWVLERMLDHREHEIARLKAELAGVEPAQFHPHDWPTVAAYDTTKKEDFQA